MCKTWVRRKLTAYKDPPVIVFELVSPGAHLWLLDVDGWHIPCRTLGQNLDAAPRV